MISQKQLNETHAWLSWLSRQPGLTPLELLAVNKWLLGMSRFAVNIKMEAEEYNAIKDAYQTATGRESKQTEWELLVESRLPKPRAPRKTTVRKKK